MAPVSLWVTRIDESYPSQRVAELCPPGGLLSRRAAETEAGALPSPGGPESWPSCSWPARPRLSRGSFTRTRSRSRSSLPSPSRQIWGVGASWRALAHLLDRQVVVAAGAGAAPAVADRRGRPSQHGWSPDRAAPAPASPPPGQLGQLGQLGAGGAQRETQVRALATALGG